MDRLSDKDLANWIEVYPNRGPVGRALAELQHLRAATAADRESVVEVVRGVCSEFLSSQGIYGYNNDIACRVADALAATGRSAPARDLIPFDSARQEYVNTIELRGAEVPLPHRTTPEQIAHHTTSVIASFWDWPGNEYSNAELIYRVALGALRRMRDLSARPIPPLVRELVQRELDRVPAGEQHDWERQRLQECLETLP